MNRKHQKSWGMAYCGIVTALCVALMLLGAVIPIAMFIAPAVAGFLVATVCVECGMQLALTAYAAVSLLALLFVPDKEVALIFVFLLGYYPLAKPKFERIRPAVLRMQHFAGAAYHGTGGIAGNAGHGQRCLCAVRPGTAQHAHDVPAGLAAETS